MQRTDSLGQQYTLTGFQAYVSVNSVLDAGAQTPVADAPGLITPEALLTVSLTLDATHFDVAFTPALPTGGQLFIRCSPQRSAGRTFEGDFRLMKVTAVDATSPQSVLTQYSARFGAPVAGNRIFVSCTVALGGFESGAIVTSLIAS